MTVKSFYTAICNGSINLTEYIYSNMTIVSIDIVYIGLYAITCDDYQTYYAVNNDLVVKAV